MSPLALLLVVIAAFFHATWNLAAKSSTPRPGFMLLSAWTLVVIWFPVALFTWIWIPDARPTTWGNEQWLCIGASSLVHLVYFYVLLEGYRAAPLSVVYPVARGLGPLFSSVGSILFLNEPLSNTGALGITAMVLGIFLMSSSTPDATAVDKRSTFVGVGYGALIGSTIAIYTLIDGYGVKHLGMNPIHFEYFGCVARGVLLLPSVRMGRVKLYTNFRTYLRPLLIVTILGPAAYILVLTAMQLAPISHVAPAREISLLIGTLMGGTLLAEGRVFRRLSAAVLIAGGVVMLSLHV